MRTGVKRPKRRTDHSSLPRAEVKNDRSRTFAHPHTFKTRTETLLFLLSSDTCRRVDWTGSSKTPSCSICLDVSYVAPSCNVTLHCPFENLKSRSKLLFGFREKRAIYWFAERQIESETERTPCSRFMVVSIVLSMCPNAMLCRLT